MKLTKLTILGLMLLSVAACNTIEGLGQDIQKAGQAIENAGEE